MFLMPRGEKLHFLSLKVYSALARQPILTLRFIIFRSYFTFLEIAESLLGVLAYIVFRVSDFSLRPGSLS